MINKVFVAEDKKANISLEFETLDEAVDFVVATLNGGKEVFEVYSALKMTNGILFGKKTAACYDKPPLSPAAS
jgi:hypothetical protein